MIFLFSLDLKDKITKFNCRIQIFDNLTPIDITQDNQIPKIMEKISTKRIYCQLKISKS